MIEILKNNSLTIMIQYKITSQMDEEVRTYDTGNSSLRMNAQDRDWSQETHTFYFSRFQLFEHTEQINQFYRYSIFLGKFFDFLGEDWRLQANYLFHPTLNCQDIFMQLLSIWLHMHPTVNARNQNPFEKSNAPVFSQCFVDEFIKRVKMLLEERNVQEKETKFNSTSIRAVCMGFFLTANDTWEQIFESQSKEKKSFSLFKGMTNTLEKGFQPLMVVTEKISNLFGRKKVKRCPSNNNVSKNNSQIFGDCYLEFRKTVDIQKQLERKMSEVCLQQKQEEPIESRKKMIVSNKFKEEESPLQKNILSNMYDYITKFIKKKHSWQVANSFVTNILDLNQQNCEVAKVKVLRPAEDFYEKLVITWLMMKKSQNKQITFQNFLKQAKLQFAFFWKDKYLLPTKYFFEKLIKHWEQIKLESKIGGQKQIIGRLINKIRTSMREDWQSKLKLHNKKAH